MSVTDEHFHRIMDSFRNFDKDGDGSINRAELREVLLKIREEEIEDEGKIDEEVEALFKHMDTDLSGTISYSEFFRAERINDLQDPNSKAAFTRLSTFFGKDRGEQEEIIRQNSIKFQRHKNGTKKEDEERKREEIAHELRKENRVLQEQNQQLQLETQKNTEEIRKMNEQLKKMGSHYEEELKNQWKKLQDEASQSKEAIYQELHKLRTEELAHKQRNEELKHEHEEMKKQCAQLEGRNKHLAEDFNEVRKQLDGLLEKSPAAGAQVQKDEPYVKQDQVAHSPPRFRWYALSPMLLAAMIFGGVLFGRKHL